ncbi:hypothetical protein GGI20_002402 [Coemansia sp. BCRC 34301]|nr:hypothetical protein GGI20_002402 [Coemansia sp. BCRC 34301]
MSTPLSTPPTAPDSVQYQYNKGHYVYVLDYVDIGSLQRCLEDRRTNFTCVDSAIFSPELKLKEYTYNSFFVLERGHFTRYSSDHPPVKFSYKYRNAAMSLLWLTTTFSDMSLTKFVEVDGLWQLEKLPVLHFVFGEDADALRSDHLTEGNTICEHYKSTVTVDMTELAAIAQSKAGLCVSHFFVVNRGKDYWVIDTRDSSINYAFDASTKTRIISMLADGLTTIQELIDDEQPLLKYEDARTSQSPNFKLYDINGEEVAEGERFALQIQSGRDDHDEQCMFNGKDWVDLTCDIAFGAMDRGDTFEAAVVDGLTYITLDGEFLQIGGEDSGSEIIACPDVPSESSRILISHADNGDIALSQWGTGVPITCEWVKAACGVIGLGDEDDAVFPDNLLRMRLVKVREAL